MRLSLSTSAIGPLYRPAAFAAKSGASASAALARRSKAWLATRPAQVLLCGILSGVYLLTFIQRFWSVFGTSLPMVAGVALAIGLGCQAAFFRAARRRHTRSGRDISSWGMVHLALAAWVIAFGGLSDGAMRIAHLVSVETLASRGFGILFSGLVAASLLAVPIYMLARLPFLHPRANGDDASTSTDLQCYIAGLACGVMLIGTVGAALIGMRNCGLIVAVISVGLFFYSLVKRNASRDLKTATTIVRFERLKPMPTVLAICSIVALGGLTAISGRLLHQLTPTAGYLLYAEWAALMLGFAIGYRRPLLQDGTSRQLIASASSACLLLATAAVVLLAGERVLIELMLVVNSRVSMVWLSMLIRCGVGAAVFLPIGWAWGRVGRSGQRSAVSEANSPPFQGGAGGGSHRSALQEPMSRLDGFVDSKTDALAAIGPPTLTLPREGGGDPAQVLAHGLGGFCGNPWPLAFVGGYLVTRIMGIPHYSLPMLLIGVSWLLAVAAVIGWISTKTFPRRTFARGGVVVAGGLLIAAGVVRDFGAGDQSAKLLFSTNVFLAKLQGRESRFLSVLDDGRLVATQAGDRGTYTVWKYRGSQLQIRESGVPKAVISTRPDTCPEYSPEKMHAILPLVLRDKPRNVLLLGLGGGEELATCVSFPVPSITCVEDDGGLIDVLRDVVWPSCAINPLDDERVSLLQIDPALAVANQLGNYDVIISRPDQAALWQTAPYYTFEFYRRAARLLSDGGIFCQRFQQIDFGPGPLRVVARTMHKSFAQVAAIETGPGEIVLLATNSPQGIVDAGFKDRLQRPHVREALAQLGWDWTVPFNLTTLNPEALAEIADEGPSPTNTADNALLTFRLPQEVMRWGDKLAEQRDGTINHAQPLLAWKGLDGDDPEVMWRLAEIAGRQRLMTAFPDQKFAYRKTLREQMEKSKESLSRQMLRKLQGEDLHPQDKQRMEYLEALSAATSTKRPSRESIDRVARFVAPFDPLLSYFVHHEVAELLTRAADPDPKSELQNRLYLAYFADNRDQSVRNLAAALNLLVEHPEVVPDPQERFDELNGLLQMLKGRWEMRGLGKPKIVQFALNDVDKTVEAAEKSLDAMDRLTQELGPSNSEWTTRREYLETALTRPLYSYRHRLLPIHLKQQQHTDELLGKDRTGGEKRTLGN